VRSLLVVLMFVAACRGKEQAKVHEDAGAGSGSGSAAAGSGSASVQVAAAFDKKCVGGDWDACRNLGVMYSEGVGVAKDPRKAAALFAQACSGGSLAGCNHMGLLLSEGLGVTKDPARAAEVYTKACDGNYGLACRNLGLLLRDGRGVPKDLTRAEVALAKACEAGTPFACTNAGDLDRVMAGELVKTKQDPKERLKKMVDHYKRGCDAQDPTACRQLGVAYLEGVGLPKSASAAAVWFERGCRTPAVASGSATPPPPPDPGACRFLGMMKFDGVGVPPDRDGGKQLLKRACDMKDADACKALELAAKGAAATVPTDAGSAN
jgi:uncharacterized protein